MATKGDEALKKHELCQVPLDFAVEGAWIYIGQTENSHVIAPFQPYVEWVHAGRGDPQPFCFRFVRLDELEFLGYVRDPDQEPRQPEGIHEPTRPPDGPDAAAGVS